MKDIKKEKIIICKISNGMNRGFTLVELLVTISMFVIITGVVLVNSNKFDSTVLLNNFAYDVALTIRQAQSYGVNIKESTSLDSARAFSLAYGVYFNTDTSPGAGGSPTNFILFQDVQADKKYEGGDVKNCPANNPSNIECAQKFSMTRGTMIKSICAGKDETDCDNNAARVNQLSIVFQRPSLKAYIYYTNTPTDNISDPQQYAKIVLTAQSGATSTVIVTSVGQIYVRK
jgi:prepilin-type N-terminal cleavage/methylation domain-containing protein